MAESGNAESVRANAARLQSIFDHLEELVIVAQVERNARGEIVGRRIIEANERFIREMGAASIEDVRGRTTTDVLGPIWAGQLLPAVTRCMETGESQTVEVLRPESGRYYVITCVRLDHDTYVGTAWDITERKRTEEALRASETKYRRLHDSLRDAFVLVSMDGRIRETNTAFREMVGYTEDELLQLTYRDLTPARWHAEDARVVSEEVLARGSSAIREKEYRRKDGSAFPIELRAHLIRNAAGEPTHMWAIVRDISERKTAEAALQLAHRRLEEALDASQVVLFHQDRNLRYTWVHNPALGYSAADIIGKRDHDLVRRPEDAERLDVIKRTVLETGIAQREEVSMLSEDGPRFFDVAVRPDLDEYGRVIGVKCAAFDITARQDYEAALRASELRYRTLLEATRAETWTCTPTSVKDGVPPSWMTLTGQSAAEAAATACAADGRPGEGRPGDGRAHAVHPDDAAGVIARWQEAVAQCVPFECEYRVHRHDGAWRWLQVTAAPVRDASGAIVEWFGATVDVTDRKLVEEELREADRQKDQFVAILAHELRNPLAPIRTAVALLKTRPLADPMLVHSRDVIDRQLAQMARLLDDLLDASRLSRGTLVLQRTRVALRDVLNAAIETAVPLIEQQTQVLILTGLDDDGRGEGDGRGRAAAAPDPVLDGDAARLIQIFGNLLTNAAKYSPPGATITVAVRIDGDTVIVSVHDTGVGIAAEHLESIFALFSQFHLTGQTNSGGLGIGLALVRRLVELHGGTISASSEGLGRGSTFTVRLPLAHVAAISGTGGLDTGSAVPVMRRRVLVAENYYYKPLARTLRRLLADGAIGDPLFLHVNALKRQVASGWRTDPALSGGGALFARTRGRREPAHVKRTQRPTRHPPAAPEPRRRAVGAWRHPPRPGHSAQRAATPGRRQLLLRRPPEDFPGAERPLERGPAD